MASGLTSTGLVIEAIDDIRTDTETDLRNTFFKGLPLGDLTLLGHIVGIIANSLGLLWERLEQVNDARDPDKATGDALDALSVLTGTFRQPATKSTATITLCGTPGTTVNSGTVIGAASTGTPPTVLFDTRDTVTIVALTAWVTTTAYVVGDRRTNSARCYQCITAGTSGGSGPATTATDITDGSVHWEYIGEGTGAVDVAADCEVTGPTQGTALDLTAIQTPVGGLASALNLLDATLGTTESTDEELRILREQELQGSGSTTKDALRSDIRKIQNVLSCDVFKNITDTTNADGVPPHAFEVLVLGGLDQTIVDTIANNLPIGIATYSSTATSGTHVDSEGVSETIYYTRPTNVNVYVVVDVNYDVTAYPTDGATEIKTAITTWGAGLPTGRDVDPTAAAGQALSVAGVTGFTRALVYNDVIGTAVAWAPTTAYVATPGSRSVVTNDDGRTYICITSGTSAGSGGPTGKGLDITDGSVHWRFLGNIFAITSRQLAVFDSTRITVNATAVAV